MGAAGAGLGGASRRVAKQSNSTPLPSRITAGRFPHRHATVVLGPAKNSRLARARRQYPSAHVLANWNGCRCVPAEHAPPRHALEDSHRIGVRHDTTGRARRRAVRGPRRWRPRTLPHRAALNDINRQSARRARRGTAGEVGDVPSRRGVHGSRLARDRRLEEGRTARGSATAETHFACGSNPSEPPDKRRDPSGSDRSWRHPRANISMTARDLCSRDASGARAHAPSRASPAMPRPTRRAEPAPHLEPIGRLPAIVVELGPGVRLDPLWSDPTRQAASRLVRKRAEPHVSRRLDPILSRRSSTGFRIRSATTCGGSPSSRCRRDAGRRAGRTRTRQAVIQERQPRLDRERQPVRPVPQQRKLAAAAHACRARAGRRGLSQPRGGRGRVSDQRAELRRELACPPARTAGATGDERGSHGVTSAGGNRDAETSTLRSRRNRTDRRSWSVAQRIARNLSSQCLVAALSSSSTRIPPLMSRMTPLGGGARGQLVLLERDPIERVQSLDHRAPPGRARRWPRRRARSSYAGPSSYAQVNACIGCSSCFAAVVTTALESRPPERHEPTSTSARSRSRTASVNSDSNSRVQSAGPPFARRLGSSCHQRPIERPRSDTISRCPAGAARARR